MSSSMPSVIEVRAGSGAHLVMLQVARADPSEGLIGVEDSPSKLMRNWSVGRAHRPTSAELLVHDGSPRTVSLPGTMRENTTEPSGMAVQPAASTPLTSAQSPRAPAPLRLPDPEVNLAAIDRGSVSEMSPMAVAIPQAAAEPPCQVIPTRTVLYLAFWPRKRTSVASRNGAGRSGVLRQVAR